MVDWMKKVFKKKRQEKKNILDPKNIAKLYRMATIDTKTQLYNYRYFNSVLKHELAVTERYNRTISLLIFDIDDFKKVNDKHGYLRGDEVLQMVATIIKSNARETDIAARFGGEEFVVLMPETDIENARIMAERIRKYIEGDKFLASFNVTISVGVASQNPRQEEVVKIKSAYEKFMPKTNEGQNNNLGLFEKANVALKYAKEHGKNRSIVYNEITRTSFLDKVEKQFG